MVLPKPRLVQVDLCDHNDWVIAGAVKDSRKCDTCGIMHHKKDMIIHSWKDWRLCDICFIIHPGVRKETITHDD